MDLIDLYLLLKLWTCVNHICSTDLCLLPIAGVTATSIQLSHCSVRLFTLSSSLVFECQKQHTAAPVELIIIKTNMWMKCKFYGNEMKNICSRSPFHRQLFSCATMTTRSTGRRQKAFGMKWKHFDVHEHFPFDLFRSTIINLTNVIFYHFLWALLHSHSHNSRPNTIHSVVSTYTQNEETEKCVVCNKPLHRIRSTFTTNKSNEWNGNERKKYSLLPLYGAIAICFEREP